MRTGGSLGCAGPNPGLRTARSAGWPAPPDGPLRPAPRGSQWGLFPTVRLPVG